MGIVQEIVRAVKNFLEIDGKAAEEKKAAKEKTEAEAVKAFEEMATKAEEKQAATAKPGMEKKAGTPETAAEKNKPEKAKGQAAGEKPKAAEAPKWMGKAAAEKREAVKPAEAAAVKGRAPARKKAKAGKRRAKHAARKRKGKIAKKNMELLRMIPRQAKGRAATVAKKAAGKAGAKKPGFRKSMENLSRGIGKLSRELKSQRVNARHALGGVQVIYTQLKKEERNVDKEIAETKSLMDFMEKKYMKREINEHEFREKMIEYNEKLHLLGLEKKQLSGHKETLGGAVKKIPQLKKPVTLEMISETRNLEEFVGEPAEAAPETTPQLESAAAEKMKGAEETAPAKPAAPQAPKAKAAEKKPVREITASAAPQKPAEKGAAKKAPVSRGRFAAKSVKAKAVQPSVVVEKAGQDEKYPEPETRKMNEFLERKISEKVEAAKKEEIEKKVGQIMKNYGISEKEMEKRLGASGNEQQLVESINKLVDMLEEEKKSHKPMEQRIETAVRFTETVKPVEEVVGVSTELKKRQIFTDFDKILDFVAAKGQVKVGDIARELNIPKNRVDVVYHTFGDAMVQSLDYETRILAEKLKKKKAGKGG